MEVGQSLLMYPNPLTLGTLNIDYRNTGNEKISEIRINNLQGGMVKRIDVNNEVPNQLQLHDIPSGAYFVQFIGDTGDFSSKLIILN
jgi:hypothetical protein